MSKSISLVQDRKPSWTPTTTYDWDIKPPPTSSLPSAPTNPATAPPEATADPAAETPAPDLTDDMPTVDDDAELPASTFNPLLYRALTGLAATLPPPPGQAPPTGQDTAGATEPVADSAMEGVAETNGIPQAGAGKDGLKAVRVGPKGLRKPKGAV